MKKKIVVFLLIIGVLLLLVGCGDKNSNSPIALAPNISIGDSSIGETVSGSYNVPGVPDSITYNFDVNIKVVNTGGGGQFKIDIQVDDGGMSAIHWSTVDTFGPVVIDKDAIYPVDLHYQSSNQDYNSWKIILYLLKDGKWENVGEKKITPIRS